MTENHDPGISPGDLYSIIEKVHIGIVIVNNDNEIKFINNKAKLFLGLFSGDRNADIGSRVISDGEREIEITREDGTLGRGEAKTVDTEWENSKARLITIRDVTNSLTESEGVRNSALYDPLTGLPNRAYFLTILEQAIARYRRNKQYTFAVLFVDLDNFKRINDSLGHEAGDKVLLKISEILKMCTRKNDAVARFAGDEFLLLLDGLKDVYGILKVVKRIQDEIRDPIKMKTRKLYIDSSVGIYISSGEDITPEEIVRYVDVAMYRAKSRGPGQYEIFDQVVFDQVMQSMKLEEDLKLAIDRNELKVYYQPIVSIADGSIKGMEALLRWVHPTKGMVSPADFIPLAENTGLIVPIGNFVFEQSVYQLKKWHAQGHLLEVSVNLSVRQLEHDKLLNFVRKVVSDSEVSSGYINFEITESIAINEEVRCIERIKELRNTCGKIKIDDFGIGYASLGCLQKLPIDVVKIDRSFISKIPGDINSLAIVKAIIAMAHTLGLKVVAEGVETEEQLKCLRAFSCDEFQGYLFSPPKPPEDLEKLLEKNRKA
ncbi:MAG: EAL domain-containing protein [Candidatus Omnitrophica bacterium]|nr:EAL domain-containing protein [Candidatus Omnitrophota bacterium]